MEILDWFMSPSFDRMLRMHRPRTKASNSMSPAPASKLEFLNSPHLDPYISRHEYVEFVTNTYYSLC